MPQDARDDAPQGLRATVRDQPLPAVGTKQAHPIARVDADRRRGACDAVGHCIELAERELPVVNDQSHSVRVYTGSMRKKFCERCDHATFLGLNDVCIWEGERPQHNARSRVAEQACRLSPIKWMLLSVSS